MQICPPYHITRLALISNSLRLLTNKKTSWNLPESKAGFDQYLFACIGNIGDDGDDDDGDTGDDGEGKSAGPGGGVLVEAPP